MGETLWARYVFPVVGEPIRGGGLRIEDERIAACGLNVSHAGGDFCDLGNVAIVPGLVNAHTHLNFSDLTAPLGHRGIRFADWLRLVMQYRRQDRGLSQFSRRDGHGMANELDRRENGAVPLAPPEGDRSMFSADCLSAKCDFSPKNGPVPSRLAGLAESLRAGVTALGDIVPPGAPLAVSPAGVTAFLELIAPTTARVAGAVESARSYLAGKSAKGPSRGLSPHAPYSVRPELLSAAVEMSREHEIPVAMHLAESAEEIELLRDGGGPLREFLEELGAWDASVVRRGSRPLDYLRVLAAAHRALVVHGNYLDDEEIAFVGANRERMSVVYCPRSHDWFAHREYPLEKLLAEGAVVALGTDGRGSSPDLSVFEEMRFAARRHPGVAKADILKMATLSGARALGLEALIGSLSPGRRADLAIVALPDREATDPHELLFDAAARVVGCYCGGAFVLNGGAAVQAAYRSGNAATS